MGDSLWVDELHTSWTVADGLGDVFVRAARGNQSPIFFWMEWLICAICGHSEIALRLVSWIAANSLIAILMVFVRRETGATIAAAAVGLLLAIDSNLIFYANEARPYALLQLCASLSAISCYRYATAGLPRQRVAWIVLAVTGCYLHYTAGLLLVAECTYLLLLRRDRSREKTGKWLQSCAIDFTVIALLLLPTLPHLFDIAGRRENWEQFVKRRDVLDVMSVLPSTSIVLVAVIAISIVVVLPFGYRCFCCGTPERIQIPAGFRNRQSLWLMTILWFVVPVVIAFTLNNTDLARVFFRRYLVSVIPATYLLIGLAISMPSRHWRLLVAAVVIGFGAYQSYTVRPFSPYLVVARHSREDWRFAIEWLNENTGATLDRELVLLRAGLIEDDFLPSERATWQDYSQLPISGLYRLDRSGMDVISLPYTNSGRLDSRTLKLLGERGEAWLLVRGRKATREEVVAASIQSTGGEFEIAAQHSFGPTLGLCKILRK